MIGGKQLAAIDCVSAGCREVAISHIGNLVATNIQTISSRGQYGVIGRITQCDLIELNLVFGGDTHSISRMRYLDVFTSINGHCFAILDFVVGNGTGFTTTRMRSSQCKPCR